MIKVHKANEFLQTPEDMADDRAIVRTSGDTRQTRVPTFEKVEVICFAEKQDTWRSDSRAHYWRSVGPPAAIDPFHRQIESLSARNCRTVFS